jgi:hypothetical protein
MAKAEGVALDELFLGRGGSSKGYKVAAKYRDPANPTQTWLGRGRQPRWYAAAIKAGKSEFLAHQVTHSMRTSEASVTVLKTIRPIFRIFSTRSRTTHAAF